MGAPLRLSRPSGAALVRSDSPKPNASVMLGQRGGRPGGKANRSHQGRPARSRSGYGCRRDCGGGGPPGQAGCRRRAGPRSGRRRQGLSGGYGVF